MYRPSSRSSSPSPPAHLSHPSHLRTLAPIAPIAPISLDTMRVDYFHSGGPSGEAVTLDRVSNDGPWPGSRTQLIDGTGLGEYFFEVIDAASMRTLYSRGFASIYGEWATTAEVRKTDRTFHESLRFPWPAEPVRVVLKKARSAKCLSRFLVGRDRSAGRQFSPAETCFRRYPPSRERAAEHQSGRAAAW